MLCAAYLSSVQQVTCSHDVVADVLMDMGLGDPSADSMLDAVDDGPDDGTNIDAKASKAALRSGTCAIL
jgi:hypothetical protein